jgi:predicted CoA-binding protein
MPDCEFPSSNATPSDIAEILNHSKVIAVVGLSPKPERPSHGVSAYMKDAGYTIIPVNPGHAEILGEKAYKSLLDVPGSIDIVNIFREPSAVPEIVDQAIQKKAKAIWMQEGIVHNDAAEKARNAGLKVVMNKCIYKEHARL